MRVSVLRSVLAGAIALAAWSSAADDSNTLTCDPNPSCEDRCRAHSEEVFKTCVAAGGDEARCAERARAAFEACLREHCDLCLCPDTVDTVCGADGRTYPNACYARCAHVEVVHRGACQRPRSYRTMMF
jgi:hypothetical protein